MHGSLDRRRLTELLDDLAERLRRAGVRANVYVVGGAAMTLAYRRDRTTHDIDARIDSGHSAIVNAVREIARERGLPESWLNEQATSYMPREADARAPTLYNSPYLVVTGASAEHMLAMKLESGRNTDRGDVETLLDHLRIRKPSDAIRIHERLFPDSTRRDDVDHLLRDILATGGHPADI